MTVVLDAGMIVVGAATGRLMTIAGRGNQNIVMGQKIETGVTAVIEAETDAIAAVKVVT